MTEVVSSSSQQASRPLTRSSAAAMATRSSAAAPAAASAGAGTALARHPQQQHHGSGGGGSGPGVPPSANHNNNAGSAGGGPAAPAHSSTSTSSSHAGHGHQRQTHHHGHGHGHHPPPPPIQTSHAHPTSARGPMTRKRAASIVTEDHHQLHNHPRIEDLSLSTPTTATTNNTAPTPGSGSRLPPDTTRDLICLCTPAPKVPRPRNGKFSSLSFQCNPFISRPEGRGWESYHLHLLSRFCYSGHQTLLPSPLSLSLTPEV